MDRFTSRQQNLGDRKRGQKVLDAQLRCELREASEDNGSEKSAMKL